MSLKIDRNYEYRFLPKSTIASISQMLCQYFVFDICITSYVFIMLLRGCSKCLQNTKYVIWHYKSNANLSTNRVYVSFWNHSLPAIELSELCYREEIVIDLLLIPVAQMIWSFQLLDNFWWQLKRNTYYIYVNWFFKNLKIWNK